MRKVRAWLCRLAGVFNRKTREAELAEEIESHLHMHIDDNLRSGMAPEEARRLALIKFGGIAPTQESYRDRLGFPSFEALFDDVRYSIRVLRKTPAFTTLALLTLILGIGANTAIFTLTDKLFLRRLQVPHPEQLALITYDTPKNRFAFTLEMVNALRRRSDLFTGIAAWADDSFPVTENGSVEVVRAAAINGEALSTLQLQPALGRLITPLDDQPGGGTAGWVTVITYDYWQKHFRGDRAVLGNSLTINSLPVRIVGVLPKGFDGVDVGWRQSIFVPIAFRNFVATMSSHPPSSGDLVFHTIGRMKSGESLAQVRAEIGRISQAVIEHGVPITYRRVFFPEGRLGISSAQNGVCEGPRTAYRPVLLLMHALVGIILLLCCANLSGLLTVRMAARARDVAVRCALGAKWLRLTRQLLIEILLLACLAAPCALVLASLTANLLVVKLIHPRYHLELETRPDANVFLFSIAITVISIFLAGLIPALQATRTSPSNGLAQPVGPLSSSLVRSRLRTWLVPLQVGISVVLVAIAGLFAGTLYHLLTVSLGFDPSGVVIVPTDLQKHPEKPEQRRLLYHKLLSELNAAPGIQIASAATYPLLRNVIANIHFALPGQQREQSTINIPYNRVANGYFEALGIRLLQGRTFNSRDEDPKHRVCILNRSAAEHLFPKHNAVGSYFTEDDENRKSTGYEIVGVVDDVKFKNLRESGSEQMYLVFQPENNEPELFLVIKANNPDLAIASARRIFHELIPDSPFLEPISEVSDVRQSSAQERVVTALSASFGILALLLTAMGVYGTLAFQVAQRTTEIGVRLALGASQAGVLRMVLKQALLPVAIGANLGTMAALTSSRLIMSLLFEVRPYSPPIYLGALLIIGVICFVAAWMPARRAAGINPIMALRCE